MKITKLQKEVSYLQNNVKIQVEIEIDASDLADFDYTGLDMLDDAVIPDILMAAVKFAKEKIHAKTKRTNK